MNKKFNTDLMRKNISSACGLMKILSNPDRMLLLCEISKKEKTVTELEVSLDIEQPTLSQQLGVLRNEGMVSTRREGKHIYYVMNNDKAMAVMKELFKQFCEEKVG